MNDHSETPGTEAPDQRPNQAALPQQPDDDTPESQVQPFPPDAVTSPIPRFVIPALENDDLPDAHQIPPLSPIRPSPQDFETIIPPSPLTPTVPERTPPERQLSPRERLQRAEEALINLRQKMARVAAEFADGKLNQAQFNAIYTRYSEQRDITERLLTRDPASQAWQSVMQTGHTQFLKQYYAARPLSYAIYDQSTFEQITITGTIQLRRAQLEAVLRRLNDVIARRGNPGPALKKLPDGKGVLFIPGEHTAAVVIFSLEPATAQINKASDMHYDFERANKRALLRRHYDTSRMVFPHRALFEMDAY